MPSLFGTGVRDVGQNPNYPAITAGTMARHSIDLLSPLSVGEQNLAGSEVVLISEGADDGTYVTW